jgi:hypothetical protein
MANATTPYDSMTPELNRLEKKVDVLLEAVTKLVLFEERQSVQAVAIKTIGIKVDQVEKDLDKWVNRGVGSWAIAATGLFLFQVFGGHVV